MTEDDLESRLDRYFDSRSPVANEAENLRLLLTQLYTDVLGHLFDVPSLGPDEAAIDQLLTSVLDAAEGRDFLPIPQPWPPRLPPG